MVTRTLVSDEDRIGEVFTPLPWAEWLISRFGIYERWIGGETVCDPTAGTGVFADALIGLAKSLGVEITDEMLGRIFLFEIQPRNLDVIRARLKQRHCVDFPEGNLFERDVIMDPVELSFDILVGNPPWANFNDLPVHYKDALKSYFIEYGLVPDRKAVLLGSSRTDIAALVIKAVIHKMLKEGGDGYFYAPLSLFTGDDAHIGFRDYRSKFERFSVKEIFEFNGEKVFEGIGTSYCACHFNKGTEQKFPVPYYRGSKDSFISYRAAPLKASDDALRVSDIDGPEDLDIEVTIQESQKPRQGVNSCGASSVFIFDEKPDFIDEDFLFPLASKEIWRIDTKEPFKWIFLPYRKDNGRPLTEEEIKDIEGFDYLQHHEGILKSRKGTLIQNSISKGIWWSLLGVGPYSFAPYKVIWEAYGKHTFTPIILKSYEGQPWQGNQAMHAFIPCYTEDDALRICEELRCPQISRLLSELNGQGKCNFAQPGKMKKILKFSQASSEQMLLLEPKTEYRTRR